MTQLKRWLDDDIPPDIERMLRAGQVERPRKRVVERAVLAFGVTSALSGITSTAVGASSKGIGAVGSLVAKWTLVSVLGLGVAATAVVTTLNQSTESRIIPVAAVASAQIKPSRMVSSRSQVHPSSEQPAALFEELVTPSSPPSTPTSATTKRSVGTTSSVAAAPIPDDSVPVADAQLAQEMQFIDRARTAMRAQNPALCLQILEEYRRAFERPRLGPESAYLRMQAAQKMGDRAMAMEVAREILRRYPSSPQVGRAEALLRRESEVPDSL